MPKNKMKRHFEMWIITNCMNCVVKVRAKGTIIRMFLFFKEHTTMIIADQST